MNNCDLFWEDIYQSRLQNILDRNWSLHNLVWIPQISLNYYLSFLWFCYTWIHTYIHTYVRTYIPIYIHTLYSTLRCYVLGGAWFSSCLHSSQRVPAAHFNTTHHDMVSHCFTLFHAGSPPNRPPPTSRYESKFYYHQSFLTRFYAGNPSNPPLPTPRYESKFYSVHINFSLQTCYVSSAIMNTSSRVKF